MYYGTSKETCQWRYWTRYEDTDIESRASNIPMDKGNYICCHIDSTDKDLRRICRSQYEHPSSAIGYWSEMWLDHVYRVLKPIGSARLTFDDDLYYMSYVIWWPNVFRSPGWDHGHDEELWNGPEVKIDIYDDAIWSPKWFWNATESYRNTRRGSGCTGRVLGLIGP